MNAINESLTFDPYEILGINKDSTDAQIIKAFRKGALKWHPDKNLDRKELAEGMFLKISQAFELLSDPAARAAYDRLQAAKIAKSIYIQRKKQTDSAVRTELLEKLRRSEAKAASNQEEAKLAEKNFEREIERLRKEGSKLLQRERETIEKELKQTTGVPRNLPSCSKAEVSPARLKVKWKNPSSKSEITEEDLMRIFGAYGDVSAVVMSSSGKRTAIVEFRDATDAMKAENEKGIPEMPFKISWISEKPTESAAQHCPFTNVYEKSSAMSFKRRPATTTTADFEDFEAEILAKMMSAEKKKRDDFTSKFDV